MVIKKHIILAIAVMALTGCRKDPEWYTPPTTGSISVQLQNMAGDQPLVLETGWYKNAAGDSLRFTTFNYFISNIKLIKEDGTVYAEQESYHLVKADNPSSLSFTIGGIPFGNYKSVSFLIGVDSVRNVSGAQTGALDMNSGMFWDWNTGYIMAKVEGYSPQAPDNGFIFYHTGGFSGAVNVLRTVSLNFNSASVTADKKPNLHLKADVLEWFKTPNQFSVKDTPHAANGAGLMKIADNYVDMFSVDHID